MKQTDISKIPHFGAAHIRLLKQLSQACAVSGDEGEVRKIVLDEIKPFADDVKIDALGNVLATRRGKSANRMRVMLAAHMDEIGLMTTYKEEDGTYRFESVGGVDARQWLGKVVWIGKDHIPGVIGAKPIHLSKADERQQPIPLDSLRIDLGGAANTKVKAGDRGTFATPFLQSGPNLRGKALDDRLGVASLIELFKNTPDNLDVMAAFTVQEEVGLRGAAVAAYTLDPQMAIVLDCTPAYDLPVWDWPDGENTRYNTHLGAGPAIYIADHDTLYDPRLIKHFKETAEALAIPYQLRQPGGGGTDAGTIHTSRAGVPSLSISVPARYIHTAISIARLKDWQNTFAMTYAALLRLTPAVLQK